MNYFAMILLILNIVVMFIYGIDKLLAKAHKRRIREAALLLCALFTGGVGAMFGMVLFNHKTSKKKFRILVPLIIVLEAAATYLIKRYL